MSSQPVELKTYHGNCHCGRFKFHLKIPTLTSVTECNCSICFKKGYKWIFPGADSFFIERGEGTLTNYDFGPLTMSHAFCGNCGTGVFGQRHGVSKDQEFAINAKILMDVDVWALDVVKSDGISRNPQYQPPAFIGEAPIPSVDITDQKLYTGSCHCGSVTVALIPKGPLSLGKDGIQACDCSICTRNGTILIYPSPSQVRIGNEDGLTSYSFGRKFQTHDFCGKCGIAVRLNKLDIGETRWKEQHPKHDYSRHLEAHPVNLRLFHDVEWKDINIHRGTWSTFGEKYVCPE